MCLAELPSAFLLNDAALVRASGSRYNTSLINSLVLYVAASVVSANGAQPPEPSGPALDLFVTLSRDLDGQGVNPLFSFVLQFSIKLVERSDATC